MSVACVRCADGRAHPPYSSAGGRGSRGCAARLHALRAASQRHGRRQRRHARAPRSSSHDKAPPRVPRRYGCPRPTSASRASTWVYGRRRSRQEGRPVADIDDDPTPSPDATALASWLGEALGARVTFAGVRRLAGGHSSGGWLLDASVDGAPRRFVLKAPGSPSLVHRRDPVREAHLMAALARLGAPVPRVVAVDHGTRAAGRPCFAMEHVDGRSVPDTAWQAHPPLGGGRLRFARELRTLTGPAPARRRRTSRPLAGTAQLAPGVRARRRPVRGRPALLRRRARARRHGLRLPARRVRRANPSLRRRRGRVRRRAADGRADAARIQGLGRRPGGRRARRHRPERALRDGAHLRAARALAGGRWSRRACPAGTSRPAAGSRRTAGAFARSPKGNP
jgi:hypothetical protein